SAAPDTAAVQARPAGRRPPVRRRFRLTSPGGAAYRFGSNRAILTGIFPDAPGKPPGEPVAQPQRPVPAGNERMGRMAEMRGRRKRGTATRWLLAAGLCALTALAACSPRVDIRGNAAEQEDIVRIRQGVTSAADVRSALGPPSTVSAFDNKIWYYISKREETVAFMAPEVKNQQVIELQFDDKQVVRRIRTYGLNDARKVDRVSRTTKAEGDEPGIFRSMIDMIVRRRAVTGRSRGSYGL
ncbi:MAG: outer membrane protein assembly factor BamE, partial [Rhodospirillaceae bacterium]|nr:outer membrane protein assembly factor BamE [Rhodospirillaceae bacterium]